MTAFLTLSMRWSLPAFSHLHPKDDTRRKVTLAHVEVLGWRLWLRCYSCGHDTVAAPSALATDHVLDPGMPPLLIARRLKYTRSGKRGHG